MSKRTKNKSVLGQSLVYVSKLFSAAVIVVLFIVAAFLIYYVVTAKVQESKNQEFDPMFTLYTIVSGSMEPTIKVYDVILSKRIDDASAIKPGDVITFISTSSISKDMVVTHRVLEVRKNDGKFEFVTKGDNNPTADSSTAKEDNLIGKTIFKIPQLGRLQFFIATKMGWFIVVLLPALGIIIYDVLKLMKIIGVKNISENLGKKIEEEEEEDLEKKAEDKKINDMFNKIKQSIKTPEDEEKESKIIESENSDDKTTPTKELVIKDEEKDSVEEIEADNVSDEIIEDKSLSKEKKAKEDISSKKSEKETQEDVEIITEEPSEEDYKDSQKEESTQDKKDQKYRFFGDDNDLESYAKEEKEERMTSEETKTRIEGIVTRYYDENKKPTPKSNNTNKPRSNNKKNNNRPHNSKPKNNNQRKNNNNRNNYKKKNSNNSKKNNNNKNR